MTPDIKQSRFPKLRAALPIKRIIPSFQCTLERHASKSADAIPESCKSKIAPDSMKDVMWPITQYRRNNRPS